MTMTPYQQALYEYLIYAKSEDINTQSFLRDYPSDAIAKQEYLKLIAGPKSRHAYADSSETGERAAYRKKRCVKKSKPKRTNTKKRKYTK
jgi:hypothetical protein